MNICEELFVLKVIYIIKQVISILSIVIPLILIILIMIDVFKVMISNEDIGNVFGKESKRLIAGILIFFIPTIVFSVFDIFDKERVEINLLCINNATKENISNLELARKANLSENKSKENKELLDAIDKEKIQAELEKIAEAQREALLKEYRENYKKNREENENNKSTQDPTSNANADAAGIPRSNSLKPFVNGKQKSLEAGDCLKWEDNCYCPTKGRATGFQFIMKDNTSRDFGANPKRIAKLKTVSAECSDGTSFSGTVSENVASNFQDAFNRLCKLSTIGINGIKISKENIIFGGTVVSRTVSGRSQCSLHAYGNAIDINYTLTITIDGKNYKPYAVQGSHQKAVYDRFVEALGSESDPRNVNYIMWEYVFKPAGFSSWGGNWSASAFDPMHYEIV